MGWKARPRYKANRQQWTLNYQGTEHYLCSGKDNEALAWREADRITGGALAGDCPATVAGLIAEWVVLYGGPWHRDVLDRWSTYTGLLPLQDLSTECLVKYARHLQEEKYGPGTVRCYVKMASRVLVWANQKKWITREFVRPKTPKAPAKYRDIPHKVLVAAFEKKPTLPKATRAILEFLLVTGARPGEAIHLQWAAVDLEGRVCTIQYHKTAGRTGEPRILHLTDRAVEILKGLPGRKGYVFLSRTGKPYTTDGLNSICRRKGFTTYQLRHTFAQEARKHVGIDVVSKLLGHKNISTTTIYCHVKDQMAAQAATALPSPLLDSPRRGRKASDDV